MKGGVPKVKNDVLDQGAKVEAGEHKWATPEQARKIAADHIRECGDGYYDALEEMEKELEEGDEGEEGDKEE